MKLEADLCSRSLECLSSVGYLPVCNPRKAISHLASLSLKASSEAR